MFFLPSSPIFLFSQVFGKNGSLKNGPNTDDLSLIKWIAEGNEQAFEQLYDRYERLVYSLVYRMLNDHGLAEDVTLEVFTKDRRALKRSRDRLESLIGNVRRVYR